MKKVIKILIMSVIICSLFISCKKDSDQSLKAIQDKKVFVLGLDDSYPPMGYRDENGEIVGFDIDVAREVCSRLGVELKTQPIDWSAKELELLTKNIDCIWNGFTVTEERKEKILFSEPYLKNRQVVIVRNDGKINSIASLSGKKVGVQAGSSGEYAFEQTEVYPTVRVVAFKDFLTAITDLKIGGVDAVIIDEIVADSQIKKASAANQLKILRSEPIASEDYAIGFRKGEQKLVDAVQQKINEMKKDGTLKKISEKWFGTDLTNI
ncbi:MAG: amino acid ABC transporter substrate-binding protein [Sphaerochaetaceae bacterium]|nr:amino acid ABC transporter substrate-binding protein [Sphaerochaetaceae bacterium]MDY5968284.1 amino acid ABC transporter substrate-binding protein [Sphaerochaetaceae bacterium]